MAEEVADMCVRLGFSCHVTSGYLCLATCIVPVFDTHVASEHRVPGIGHIACCVNVGIIALEILVDPHTVLQFDTRGLQPADIGRYAGADDHHVTGKTFKRVENNGANTISSFEPDRVTPEAGLDSMLFEHQVEVI